MRIIRGNRGSGKTQQLLKAFKEDPESGVLVVRDRNHKTYLVSNCGLKSDEVITYSSMTHKQYLAGKRVKIWIDDIGHFLSYMFEKEVAGFTVEDEKFVYPSRKRTVAEKLLDRFLQEKVGIINDVEWKEVKKIKNRLDDKDIEGSMKKILQEYGASEKDIAHHCSELKEGSAEPYIDFTHTDVDTHKSYNKQQVYTEPDIRIKGPTWEEFKEQRRRKKLQGVSLNEEFEIKAITKV